MKTQVSDLTTDTIERRLVELESWVSRIRAEQLVLLREVDLRQVPLADGCRSLSEWTAGRLDVAPETAKQLVAACTALQDQSDVESDLDQGLVSFDRAHQTARLATAGASDEHLARARGLDIPGLRRLAASLRHMTRTGERELFESRFLAVQPNLDSSAYRLWGQLPGTDGEIVCRALTTRADSFPSLPDGTRPNRGQRHADALISIAADSLTSSSGDQESSRPVLSVFTTADAAITSDGEAGSTTASGVSVGRSTIEEIFCTGSVESILIRNGQPSAQGRTSRVIPPRLRRYVLWRDGGCAADGCTSRYQLQPHHRIPWSQGGATDPDNLVTLCCRIRRLRPISSGDSRRRRRNRASTTMSSSIRWNTRFTRLPHPNGCVSFGRTARTRPDPRELLLQQSPATTRGNENQLPTLAGPAANTGISRPAGSLQRACSHTECRTCLGARYRAW